ncbi:MAG: carboxypeptidase regulatory-like domain-containing protein [Proteobacteria bacterium]|nr:carboxypeptidase regulatory-like domain-containing protein [Pseudomonadota bacterium]MBU1420587.1 carboxypeptidase regulatory-like domain-containing protein [Pseudomonadota bacterium]MBU1454980.1 carboxypeptidase regulatory-like domain-containing protein [Pseudomonadota bacterium]
MMTPKLTGILFIACLLVSSTLSFAAKPIPNPDGTGTLTGKVLIAGTRTAIVGATVTAVGNETYTATTNSTGVYTIFPVAGGYTVTATADGYNNQTFSATVRSGKKTNLNFTLSEVVSTAGVLNGTVTDATSGNLLSDVLVATNIGGYSTLTVEGQYSMVVTAGDYSLTASLDGYQSATKDTVSVAPDQITTTNFALNELSAGLSITALTATPDSFREADATTISLVATVDGAPDEYIWAQVYGPKVALTGTGTTAIADVSSLEVAAECELVFELTVAEASDTASKTVTVLVQPADILQYPGPNVQIGGSTTAVARFQYNSAEWCLFNIGTTLKATTVGISKGAVYDIILPGIVYDIEIFNYSAQTYAVVAIGSAGVAVVNISDPANMSLISVAPVNYYFDGVTYTEGGGSILYDNTFESKTGPVVALASDGTDLYLGDNGFGIHKTSLANLFGDIRETDGTLLIDQEVLTVQYAGEHAWGGPMSLKFYGGKLFAGLGALGMGIFDPATLEQTGRYNLYTDESRTEDYFGAMALSQTVHSDLAGDLFLDDFTGMPDYRQVNYEIGIIMHGTEEGDTPWADFEREGKWYYEAVDVDVAQQGDRTIAYIAYSLGGVIAVDITDFETATATNFLTAPYLGYFVAVPANGPYDTGSAPSSLLPYEGAGMLKESGVLSVNVLDDRLYLTDHFAGLVILNSAGAPENWHGVAPPYNNDTDGIPDNNVPEFEDVTSYDMSPWDPSDNESLQWAYYQTPCELATRELNGHGYGLALMDEILLSATGQIDILECSTAGGLVFVNVVDIEAPLMDDRFEITVHFPSTDEIGAAPDGSATATISLGHTDGIAATENYIYVSDGPHGITAWKITDDEGYPTDEVHVVANTLQDEYPIDVGGELIYPASHTVRNVIDPNGQFTWALCVGNGMRRIPIADVEAGLGEVGMPLLMKLHSEDSFEHNADWGVVKMFNYQDQAYDVEFFGNYAYVADGTNGLTIYDTTKDPTDAHSGFFVGNIGNKKGNKKGNPLLGTVSGIELWTDPTGKRYAILACGPYGVGVVDITDINNMQIVKVFEPIKYENGDLGSADGQAIDVEVVGNNAYFGYDSFGLVAYSMADLVDPLPDGVDPTELFKKEADGAVVYDYRPEFLGKFKLQEVEGYENVDGGSVKMAYTQQSGNLYFYTAFGHYGVVKIDYTDAAAPVFLDAVPTASECVDVEISNGRLYVGDHAGGLVLFK